MLLFNLKLKLNINIYLNPNILNFIIKIKSNNIAIKYKPLNLIYFFLNFKYIKYNIKKF